MSDIGCHRNVAVASTDASIANFSNENFAPNTSLSSFIFQSQIEKPQRQMVIIVMNDLAKMFFNKMLFIIFDERSLYLALYQRKMPNGKCVARRNA